MDALRIAVYPHAMHIGGSQLNAIELAGALHSRGHEVLVVGEPGPLVDRVGAMGLEHVAIPLRRQRPSPTVARQLYRLSRRRSLHIVHGYEWPPALEAAAATAMPGTDAAAVCTIMSMAVAPFLPLSMPLVVGTDAIRDQTARGRRGPVDLIEPPVDVVANAPGQPTDEFRARFGLDDGDAQPPLTIGMVTRLAPELKLEGVVAAVDAVALLADLNIRLVITGDGVARDVVEARAAQANRTAGRRVVILTGELADPRPAYAAADIMLGMGGSALRALAFGQPLVVQGERGFWQLLTPESLGLFLRQGWYGLGDGGDGARRLAEILRLLVADERHRAELGAFGRRLAVERFSLQRAAQIQEDIYLRTIVQRRRDGRRPGRAIAQGLRSGGGLVVHEARGRLAGLRRHTRREDFNVAVLAETSMRATTAPGTTAPGPAAADGARSPGT